MAARCGRRQHTLSFNKQTEVASIITRSATQKHQQRLQQEQQEQRHTIASETDRTYLRTRLQPEKLQTTKEENDNVIKTGDIPISVSNTAGPCHQGSMPMSYHTGLGYMLEEMNAVNTMDQENNSDVSFSDEQLNDVTLWKCFLNAKKADFRKTKNGK